MKLFRKYEKFAQLSIPIVCLSLGVFACSSKKPAEQPASTAEEDAAADAAQAEQEMVFEGPGELLPKGVDGWEISSAPRYFGPDNLYDLINGGAEVFVDYELEKMVTADYRSKSAEGKTVTVEIYNQGSPKGAFGRLSRYLSEIEDPSEAGSGLPEELEQRGILGTGDLKVWRGPYLVHLTLLDETAGATEESISSAGKQLLPGLASAILANIEANPPVPEILASFPEEGRIERSQLWTPGSVLKIDALGPGFTVRYKVENEEMTLFVTEELASKEAAQEAAEKASKAEPTVVARTAGTRVVGGRAQNGPKNKALTTRVKALADAVSAK